MTFEIAFMMALIAVALLLFASEALPLEVTAMLMLAVLLLMGIIDIDEAISGLSNKAVVTVAAMLILGQALVKTGVLSAAADRLAESSGARPWYAFSLALVAVGLLSGFLNNTAIVAIFIPLMMDLCRRFRISPSKVMLPLSYVAVAGGTLTVIGTSTNLLVSAIAEDHGLEPFGMFEFAALGSVLLAVALAYVLLAGRALLPARSTPEALTHQYQMRHYLTEVQVTETSPLIGHTIAESALSRDYDVTVISVHRGVDHVTDNLRQLRILPEDVLVVRGSAASLMRLSNAKGLAPLSDVQLSDASIADEGQLLVGAIVGRDSSLIGRTLEEIDFRQRVGAFVLAIRRGGSIRHEKVARTPLQFADDLLLVMPEERVAQLQHSDDLIVTARDEVETRLGGTKWAILLILPAVIIFSATGVVEITAAAVVGCVAVLVLRAIRPAAAYRALDLSVLLLIAAFVPVGVAMEKTGTARFVADGIIRLRDLHPDVFTPAVMVSVLYLLTSLLTQTISNNATAILLAPIALQLANDLSVDPRPFLVAVCFGASAEFMTPYGYQTNLMVMGPGNYRFLDYVRFGAPLNLLFWIIASLLIPVLWSLRP